MVKERPILFKGPLVRAILDGSKTKTRRLPRFQPAGGVRRSALSPTGLEDGHGRVLRCQHGAPGDHLWVRENFKTLGYGRHFGIELHYQAYGYDPEKQYEERERFRRILDEAPDRDDKWRPVNFGPWKPSIHMPRWASRIDLEITEVRIERLQDITEEDARAEGLEPTFAQECWSCMTSDGGSFAVFVEPDQEMREKENLVAVVHRPRSVLSSSREVFARTWDLINGDRASWLSNPWVWSIGFKVVNPSCSVKRKGEG